MEQVIHEVKTVEQEEGHEAHKHAFGRLELNVVFLSLSSVLFNGNGTMIDPISLP